MALLKLTSGLSKNQKITVSATDMLLAFKMQDGSLTVYFFYDTWTPVDLAAALKLKDVKEVKYLGGQKPRNSLNTIKTSWPPFKKEVFVKDNLTVFFSSDSAQIKVAKSNKIVPSQKKNVLIIDDSRTIQKLLSKIISGSDELQVAAVADDTQQAKAIIESMNIDLITLDIHLPGTTGVEFLKSYLKFRHIPTVMISSVSLSEGPLVIEALSNGAATYIQKPSSASLGAIAEKIVTELELVSRKTKNVKSVCRKSKLSFDEKPGLIAIGSSTGGTEALRFILSSLPDNVPPIVIVQHIPAVFSKALADRLNELCPFTVKEAVHEEQILPNTVYIAPGGIHMKVQKPKRQKDDLFVQLEDAPPMNRFKPSVDYLFKSLAQIDTPMTAAILTGMGKDGAQGLLELKKRGAFTIAQDEASSVVFGMPKRAIEIGAVQKIISLEDMSDGLVKCWNRSSKLKSA